MIRRVRTQGKRGPEPVQIGGTGPEQDRSRTSAASRYPFGQNF
jgi:hypothetical protein